MSGFTYIMTNKPNGTLYIGVTSDLVKRVWEHREGVAEGFTKRYGLSRQVWFERFDRIEDAIVAEKQMKSWRRSWKLNAILSLNPQWDDLWDEITR